MRFWTLTSNDRLHPESFTRDTDFTSAHLNTIHREGFSLRHTRLIISMASCRLPKDYAPPTELHLTDRDAFLAVMRQLHRPLSSTVQSSSIGPGSDSYNQGLSFAQEEHAALVRPPTLVRRGIDPHSSRNVRDLGGISEQHGHDLRLDLAIPEQTPCSDVESSGQDKRPATFLCTLCPKRFTRAYNLRSHLRTHTDERPFVCSICGKAFARQHDRKRHEGLHSGEEEFVCRGTLESSASWGCGRRFARADVFGRHFRSEAGRVCIKPLFDEEAIERQKAWLKDQREPLAGFMMSQAHYGLTNSPLPGALLRQYPALAGLDWNSLPQGPPPDEEVFDEVSNHGEPNGNLSNLGLSLYGRSDNDSLQDQPSDNALSVLEPTQLHISQARRPRRIENATTPPQEAGVDSDSILGINFNQYISPLLPQSQVSGLVVAANAEQLHTRTHPHRYQRLQSSSPHGSSDARQAGIQDSSYIGSPHGTSMPLESSSAVCAHGFGHESDDQTSNCFPAYDPPQSELVASPYHSHMLHQSIGTDALTACSIPGMEMVSSEQHERPPSVLSSSSLHFGTLRLNEGGARVYGAKPSRLPCRRFVCCFRHGPMRECSGTDETISEVLKNLSEQHDTHVCGRCWVLKIKDRSSGLFVHPNDVLGCLDHCLSPQCYKTAPMIGHRHKFDPETCKTKTSRVRPGDGEAIYRFIFSLVHPTLEPPLEVITAERSLHLDGVPRQGRRKATREVLSIQADFTGKKLEDLEKRYAEGTDQITRLEQELSEAHEKIKRDREKTASLEAQMRRVVAILGDALRIGEFQDQQGHRSLLMRVGEDAPGALGLPHHSLPTSPRSMNGQQPGATPTRAEAGAEGLWQPLQDARHLMHSSVAFGKTSHIDSLWPRTFQGATMDMSLGDQNVDVNWFDLLDGPGDSSNVSAYMDGLS
jgi:hypothetical protein